MRYRQGMVSRRLRRRAVVIGLGLVAVSVLLLQAPARTPGRDLWPWFLIFGVIPLLVITLGLVRGRGGSAGTVTRWSRRSRRNHGMASRWRILRVASSVALRRKATVLRPSLRQVRWWRRWRVPARELGTSLARVGLLRVWSPVEDVTLRIGGPRTGKTGELAGRILDAPGAVIATSTRTDLVELTGACRARRGPVGVFNPSGLGGLDSTVTIDLLAGCDTPSVATATATDLLSATSAPGAGGDREFWSTQARRVLASLLHAAALAGGSMRDVLAWVADPEGATDEVASLLRRSPEPAYVQDALQFLTTNDRTRSSITSTIMPALGWLTDSTATAAATGGSFDVAKLLNECGTVYMLGAEDAQVAPLVTALTGRIARQARRIAATEAGGRLDPPLTLALDEAALICPVPLDNWTADMGGRGVTIHIAAQSRSQLKQRWGGDGAATILNNAATLMIYGATRDPEDLQAYSQLAGDRYEDVPTFDHEGHLTGVSSQRVPVLSVAQIAQLPPRRVLLIRRNMPPVIGRVRMAWKRHDVKAAARAPKRAARLARWQTRIATAATHTGSAATRAATAAGDARRTATARWQTRGMRKQARQQRNQGYGLPPVIESIDTAEIDRDGDGRPDFQQGDDPS